MGMPEASDEDIERALTLSGALPFVQKQKNGLNYMIQEGDLAFWWSAANAAAGAAAHLSTQYRAAR